MASEALTSSALFPSRELIPPLREAIAQVSHFLREVRQAVHDRFSSPCVVDEANVACRFDEQLDQPDSEPVIVGHLK